MYGALDKTHNILKMRTPPRKYDLCSCFPVEYWFTMCDQECLSNSNSIVFPAEINLFNAESNHPLRLHCSAFVHLEWLSVLWRACVCTRETKTTCAVEGASESGARVRSVNWHLICHSADRLTHLAGHTRCSPSFSLPFPFLPPSHKVYLRVHLQASAVDTHTLLRVAHTHVFQWLVLSSSEKKKSSCKLLTVAIRCWWFLWIIWVQEYIWETLNCLQPDHKGVSYVAVCRHLITCTLKCAETKIFILCTNHERLHGPKRAFSFNAHLPT